MAGTIAGGKKAASTNKDKYGSDFYKRIGSMGGQTGNSGGFASDVVGPDGLTGKERARLAGQKGGRISRRGSGIKINQDWSVSDEESFDTGFNEPSRFSRFFKRRTS